MRRSPAAPPSSWRSRPIARLAAITVALGLALPAGSATAQSQTDPYPMPRPEAHHPNHPYIPLDPPPACGNIDDPQIDEFTDYAEMTAQLADLEQRARHPVEVESVGLSNRGRELWSARVGTGDQVFLLIGEIHGNEKVGPDAIFRIVDWLGNSNARAARTIRDNLTLVAIPKINPDGAEANQRQSSKLWSEVVEEFPQLEGVEPAWNYNANPAGNEPGFDLNRDFHPDLGYEPQPEDFPGDSAGFGWFINHESQALRDLYLDLQDEFGEVDVFVDVHHQGSCVAREDTRELIDVAVDYPPLPDWEFEPGGKYADYENRQDYSRQLAMSAAAGVFEEGFQANRYAHAPERDIPGQARSSFALNGTGTVLFEIRGQSQGIGQLGRERFTRATVGALYRMLHDVATGDVHDYNPAAYDTEIPGNVTLRPGQSSFRAAVAEAADAPDAQDQHLID